MVIHSELSLFPLRLLVPLGVAAGVLASVILLLALRFRLAAKVLLVTLSGLGAYVFLVVVVFLLTPQRIVKVGDIYCWDSWCMGVEKVNAVPRGRENVYSVDVRILSDIGRGKTSAEGASLYLLDERARHFPLQPDPAAIPFDQLLGPGETFNTSLTFVVPSDVSQLYLTGDAPGGALPIWAGILIALLPMDPHFGLEESLLHRRTLLRVL